MQQSRVVAKCSLLARVYAAALSPVAHFIRPVNRVHQSQYCHRPRSSPSEASHSQFLVMHEKIWALVLLEAIVLVWTAQKSIRCTPLSCQYSICATRAKGRAGAADCRSTSATGSLGLTELLLPRTGSSPQAIEIQPTPYTSVMQSRWLGPPH